MGIVRFRNPKGRKVNLRLSDVSHRPSIKHELKKFKDKTEKRIPSGGIIELKIKRGKVLKPSLAPGGLFEMLRLIFQTRIEVIANKMKKVFKWSLSFILGMRLNKGRNNGRTNPNKSKEIGKSLKFA